MSLLLLFRPREGEAAPASDVVPDVIVTVSALVRTVRVPAIVTSVVVPPIQRSVKAPQIETAVTVPAVPRTVKT